MVNGETLEDCYYIRSLYFHKLKKAHGTVGL